MARKKTGRLIHWGCWNYPGTAIAPFVGQV